MLSIERRLEIYKRISSGEKPETIAEEYGIIPGTVRSAYQMEKYYAEGTTKTEKEVIEKIRAIPEFSPLDMTRVINAMFRHNIRSMGQLKNTPLYDLKRMRILGGEKTLQILIKHGYVDPDLKSFEDELQEKILALPGSTVAGAGKVITLMHSANVTCFEDIPKIDMKKMIKLRYVSKRTLDILGQLGYTFDVEIKHKPYPKVNRKAFDDYKKTAKITKLGR